jgi:UDP-N-acetylglucosamine--N-acetylmuramyl-(pentapeptide) pyrophosphoryl-undecaprenol N-acetylglucosamine transferase
MRLLVSAGASGGGIYPALAVLQALGDSPEEILWVGGEKGMETDLVNRAGVPFKAIPAAGLHGVGLKAISGVWQLTRGYFAARKIIREFKPDVLFFTGGYVAIPTGLAGRKVPMALCLPDIEPALALRTLARSANLIAVPAEESKAFFSKKKRIEVVGYPTRPSMQPMPKEEALKLFGLSPDKPVLMVTGGSLGALSLNRAVIANLDALLSEVQVIHLAGERTWPEVADTQAELADDLTENYRPFAYLHDRMRAAFSAADLVVSRAGASTLGELPAFGVPAILVPYPHAWRYQKVNAEYLAGRGAAVVVRDEELAEQFLPLVKDLLIKNPENRYQMQIAMKSLAVPDAAKSIAQFLQELAESAKKEVGNG